MAIDQQKIYIGTENSQLLQCHPSAHELQPLLPTPEGVQAELLKILPINGLLLLAFGDASVTMNPESDSGAVIAYNDITQQGTLLYGLGNWKDMVVIDDVVWVAGKSGVMRIPLALIHRMANVPPRWRHRLSLLTMHTGAPRHRANPSQIH